MDEILKQADSAIAEAHHLGKLFSVRVGRSLMNADLQAKDFMLYMRKRQLEESIVTLRQAAAEVERQTRWTVTRCRRAHRYLTEGD